MCGGKKNLICRWLAEYFTKYGLLGNCVRCLCALHGRAMVLYALTKPTETFIFFFIHEMNCSTHQTYNKPAQARSVAETNLTRLIFFSLRLCVITCYLVCVGELHSLLCNWCYKAMSILFYFKRRD